MNTENQIPQNRNNLEKIIKMDTKNGNFDLDDTFMKQKLKIRTSQKNSKQINGGYQNEHTLCFFWRHIQSTYFRKVDMQEYERINYIRNMLAQPFYKLQDPKYSDYTSYFTVQQTLNKQAIQKKIDKKEAASLYFKTILKHIKLSNMIYNAFQYHNVDFVKLEAIYHKKERLMSRMGAKNLMVALSEENRQLDLLIGKVEKLVDQRNPVKDQIEQEIMNLEEEFTFVNKQNIHGMSNLENKIQQNFHHKDFPLKKRKYRKRRSKSLDADTDESTIQNIQLEFLRRTILKLEQRQVADSITKIIQTNHQGNNYQFNVAFEQALNSNFHNFDEPTLLELDKLRDLSLFKFYNIPQKTRYSHIANNYLAIQHITANRLKPNALLQKNLFTLMKQQSNNNNVPDQIISKFDNCHHCRMLFREENLMTCNYKSGTMGLPIINPSLTDTFVLQQIDNETTNRQNRRVVPSRKRNTYSMYARKNGELVCSRKFCRQCLKQCYEYNITDTLNRADWVCPFCQGICYCVRCQRNDILSRLKGMYMVLGGNIKEIQDGSMLEKYVKPQQEEFFYKKKQQTHGFQRTGYSFFRQQFNNFKNMQEVRLDFENLRLLCSCINKREKLKMKIIQNELENWLYESKDKPKQKPANNFSKAQLQEFEESLSSNQNMKLSKAKQKYERKQQLRLERTKRLIQQFYPKSHHNPNSPPEDEIKLKRELKHLILTQDTQTYNLVVKKIKDEESS